MRGSVQGTSVLDEHRMEVSGQAPLKDLQAYHSRLESLTGGEGSFAMEFSHYAPVTSQLSRQLVSEFRGTAED
jgi:elongation factor G